MHRGVRGWLVRIGQGNISGSAVGPSRLKRQMQAGWTEVSLYCRESLVLFGSLARLDGACEPILPRKRSNGGQNKCLVSFLRCSAV
jgi:hypothetical protein